MTRSEDHIDDQQSRLDCRTSKKDWCVVLSWHCLHCLYFCPALSVSLSVCQTSQFTRMSNEWPVWWRALFHWALTIEGSCGIIKSLWNNLTDSQDQDQEVRKYSGSNICPESDLTKPSWRNPAVKLQPCRTWAGLTNLTTERNITWQTARLGWGSVVVYVRKESKVWWQNCPW